VLKYAIKMHKVSYKRNIFLERGPKITEKFLYFQTEILKITPSRKCCVFVLFALATVTSIIPIITPLKLAVY